MPRYTRATVEGCLALLSLPESQRREEVARLDRQEDQSRSETYSYISCSVKGCKGKIRVLRAANNHPDLCTACYSKLNKKPEAQTVIVPCNGTVH